MSADVDKLRVELVPDLSGVDAAAWNAIAGEDDPFAEHAFLRALETSKSVGHDSGWAPTHVLAWRGTRLVGALPLYVKQHSYGEYIFDWSWASAAERSGIRYYPKLASMVPFTPATGTRFLVSREESADDVVTALLSGVSKLAEKIRASSVHLLFLNANELRMARDLGAMMPRVSSQFHWDNPGYRDFDDYLERFRSSQRKQVRRERRDAAAHGFDIRLLTGNELRERDWHALRGFYRDTCLRKGSGPYLTDQFFDHIAQHHAHRVVALLAYDGERPVAGTLSFQKGKHLYGRYWGAVDDLPALHFELCYYRLIEHAIAQRLTHFEAGAQGTHKLRRGLVPVEIHSAHWIAHPGLADAIAEFLPREAAAVRREISSLAEHSPFHRAHRDDE